MARKAIPAISIVIPMYNTEKFVGACLDSILAQTFGDYEVIVVDDCSTDNSAAIIENYAKRFARGGVEFNLIRQQINSGGAAVPRNIGMKLSRGKYLMFIDSDDVITKTALREFYNAAEDFDADVVACEKWYQTPMNGDIADTNSLTIIGPPAIKRISAATVVDDDMIKRVTELYQLQFSWSSCMKLIRRDFLFGNNFEIPNISGGEDTVFTCCLICSGARYVRVPNVTYIYRIHNASSQHSATTIKNLVHKWTVSLIRGFQYLDKFLSEREFFRQHPDIRYMALDCVVREFTGHLLGIYSQFPAYQLDDLIRAEIEQIGSTPALASFIFNRMNLFDLNFTRQNQANAKLRQQIQELQAQIQQLQKQP